MQLSCQFELLCNSKAGAARSRINQDFFCAGYQRAAGDDFDAGSMTTGTNRLAGRADAILTFP
jgi:hypothetical protein